jgi:hypothetical protein
MQSIANRIDTRPRTCGGGDNGGVSNCSVLADLFPINGLLKRSWRSYGSRRVIGGVERVASPDWREAEGRGVSMVRREPTRWPRS